MPRRWMRRRLLRETLDPPPPVVMGGGGCAALSHTSAVTSGVVFNRGSGRGGHCSCHSTRQAARKAGRPPGSLLVGADLVAAPSSAVGGRHSDLCLRLYRLHVLCLSHELEERQTGHVDPATDRLNLRR